MLPKSTNASTFHMCDIGHPVSQKNKLTATLLWLKNNDFYPNKILRNLQNFVMSQCSIFIMHDVRCRSSIL